MSVQQDQTIIFENPNNLRTGFLSNESKHSFILEGKRWPSVEHYIQAKKFEGTEYEDEIRLASTIFQAKRMGEVRFLLSGDKKIKAKKTQNNQVYCIRDDWNKVKKIFMKEAIQAKFMQNNHLQKKLIDTYEFRLIDKSNPLTGRLLQNLRDNLKNKTDVKVDIPLIKDLKNKDLKSNHRKVLWKLIHLSEYIAKIERWDVIQPQMVYDAIYNFNFRIKIYRSIIDFINEIKKIDWSDIFENYPNYEQIIRDIQITLIRKKLATDKEVAQNIAGFFMWLEQRATIKQRKIIYNIDLYNITVSFPKEERGYRISPPFKRPKKFRGNNLWKRWKKFPESIKNKYENNIQLWLKTDPKFKRYTEGSIKIKNTKRFDDWADIVFDIFKKKDITIKQETNKNEK